LRFDTLLGLLLLEGKKLGEKLSYTLADLEAMAVAEGEQNGVFAAQKREKETIDLWTILKLKSSEERQKSDDLHG